MTTGTAGGRQSDEPVRAQKSHEDGEERVSIVRVVGVSAGYAHSLVVSDDGQLWSFGDGDGGRLGHGQSSDHTVSVPILVYSLVERGVSVVGCARKG